MRIVGAYAGGHHDSDKRYPSVMTNLALPDDSIVVGNKTLNKIPIAVVRA